MNDLQIFQKNIEKIQLPLKDNEEIVNLLIDDFEKFPYKLTNTLYFTKLKIGEVFTVKDQI